MSQQPKITDTTQALGQQSRATADVVTQADGRLFGPQASTATALAGIESAARLLQDIATYSGDPNRGGLAHSLSPEQLAASPSLIDALAQAALGKDLGQLDVKALGQSAREALFGGKGTQDSRLGTALSVLFRATSAVETITLDDLLAIPASRAALAEVLERLKNTPAGNETDRRWIFSAAETVADAAARHMVQNGNQYRDRYMWVDYLMYQAEQRKDKADFNG